jgi:hypothetical protein
MCGGVCQGCGKVFVQPGSFEQHNCVTKLRGMSDLELLNNLYRTGGCDEDYYKTQYAKMLNLNNADEVEYTVYPTFPQPVRGIIINDGHTILLTDKDKVKEMYRLGMNLECEVIHAHSIKKV